MVLPYPRKISGTFQKPEDELLAISSLKISDENENPNLLLTKDESKNCIKDKENEITEQSLKVQNDLIEESEISNEQNCYNTKRIMSDRKIWRNESDKLGFSAAPKRNEDGTLKLTEWECGIPGKTGSLLEGVVLPMILTFPELYPLDPPECRFKDPVIFHPNIFPSGLVCVDLLEKNWNENISIKEILMSIQTKVDSWNNDDPACAEAYCLHRYEPELYIAKLTNQIEALKQ